jgi:predicted patatin/cPLA2 family phospholipase
MSEMSEAQYFFNKFKEGLNRGIRIVNVRSKEAYDTVLIRNRIRSLKKRRTDSVLEMGNMIYRTFKYKGRINQDTVKTKCADIENIEREIEKCEEELNIVHINADKALGSVKALAKPTVVSTCECGAEIYEGAAYCAKCSKKVV